MISSSFKTNGIILLYHVSCDACKGSYLSFSIFKGYLGKMTAAAVLKKYSRLKERCDGTKRLAGEYLVYV
jgi:hypothetical protein